MPAPVRDTAAVRPVAATSAFAWTALAFLWFAYALNYLDRQVVFSIFPVLRSDLHFSDALLRTTNVFSPWRRFVTFFGYLLGLLFFLLAVNTDLIVRDPFTTV